MEMGCREEFNDDNGDRRDPINSLHNIQSWKTYLYHFTHSLIPSLIVLFSLSTSLLPPLVFTINSSLPCVCAVCLAIGKKKNSSKLKRSLAMICWVFLILSFCYCEDESIDNLPHGFFNTQFSFHPIGCSRARPLLVWIGKEKRGGKKQEINISNLKMFSYLLSYPMHEKI